MGRHNYIMDQEHKDKISKSCKGVSKRRERRVSNELIFETAKRFKTTGEWRVGDLSTYRVAKRWGIFEEATAHMVPRKKVVKIKKIKKAETEEGKLKIKEKREKALEYYESRRKTIEERKNFIIGKIQNYEEELIKVQEDLDIILDKINVK